VPRRSRGHIYRKRTTPPVPAGPSAGEDRSEPDGVEEPVTADISTTQPAPYIRRQSAATTLSRAPAPAQAPRAGRALVTDYGYVVGELKRIGLTFGGLIVLLIVISRFLH
jgi:hypothetical protein